MSIQKIVQFELQSPTKKIARFNRISSNYLSKPLNELGLAHGTLAFLMEVIHCNGIIQQDISRNLSIDRAATARALQQLEENGFIQRKENELNRREKCAFTTQKTKELEDTFLSILQEHHEKVFRGFTSEEKNALLSMLDRMIKNLQGS